MTTSVGAVGELGPSPQAGADLQFTVTCRTTRRGGRGRRHEVRILADWSVETPHDLESERVAAAFGGYCSCLDLEDKVVPAAREWLGYQTRQVRPPVVRQEGRWGTGCARCPQGGRSRSADAASAAGHYRGVEHYAVTQGASKWQIAEMFAAMREVWDDVVQSRLLDDDLRRLVRTDSITSLWEAGVHPDQVEAHARLARDAGVPDALPELYFLGMAYGDRDPAWVAQNLLHCPTGDNATRLAWWPTGAAPAQPGDVGRWLGLGVPAHQIPNLTSVGARPADSEQVAGSVGMSCSSSARLLARWAALDVRLSARHAQSLDSAGQLQAGLPGRAAVDRLLERLRAQGEVTGQHSEVDWSDAAVLLAVHGTVASAAWAIRRGQHIDLQTDRSEVGRADGDRNEA